MLRSYAPAAYEALTPAMRHPPADPACHFSCLPPTLHLKMQSPADQARLLHRTTIALSQLHGLLQQATDVLANLHSLYLVHTRQVDPQFHRPFPPLPPAVPIPSPTSSCDSAPTAPSSTHHHSLQSHKHPQPPPLHHHHHPRGNVSLHHPSKRMLIGTHGMATLKFALWNSKLIPACDQIGTTLLVEWVSQLHSAKHAGKNFKKHNADTKQSFHPHLLHPPTRHHLFPLFTHLLLQQPSHHCHHLQLQTSLTLLQHLHHFYRPPWPLTMLCQQPSVRTVIRNQKQLTSAVILYSLSLTWLPWASLSQTISVHS